MDRTTRSIDPDDDLSEMVTVLRFILGIGPVAGTRLIAEMPWIITPLSQSLLQKPSGMGDPGDLTDAVANRPGPSADGGP